jgi:hypothetical protein
MSPVAAEVASADRAPAPDDDRPPVVDPAPVELLATAVVDGVTEPELEDEPQPDAPTTAAAHAKSVVIERSMVRMLQRAPELLLNSSFA